ncbi:MAG: hypothetical protein J4F42_12665 [Desulfurellaceae bacterium]|nr:hypothetical protein [Desulfurellaceae bacterium]
MVKVDDVNTSALQILRKPEIVCQDEIPPPGQTDYSAIGEAESHELLHLRDISTCYILLFEQSDIGREFLEIFALCRFS